MSENDKCDLSVGQGLHTSNTESFFLPKVHTYSKDTSDVKKRRAQESASY